MLGFGIGVIVVLDWRPVNSEADLESDDRHLLEALQDGPSPQAGEINNLVRIVLFALGGFLRRTAHLDLNLDIAFTFTFAFTLHLFVAAAT